MTQKIHGGIMYVKTEKNRINTHRIITLNLVTSKSVLQHPKM